MIDVIQIEGFQSHKNTEIELHPGVNVIIGKSDSGKSSVIRALTWLNENRPRGDSFRNDSLKPKDEVSVCEVFKDGTYVARNKGKGVNEYYVSDPDNPLEALRTDVPTEVRKETNIHKVNIQSQHPTDQYFMLTEKPGKVAKMFNEVAGLGVMDKAMKEINSRVRENNSQLKLIESEIKDTKISVKNLNWVKLAVKKAEAFTKKQIEIDKKIKLFDEIDEILFEMSGIDKELEDFEILDKAFVEVESIVVLNDRYEAKIKGIRSFGELINQYKKIDLKLYAYRDIDEALKRWKSIGKHTTNVWNLYADIEYLKKILKSITKTEETIKRKEVLIEDMQSEIDSYLSDNPCPLCGK